jgi:diacylglycerol kinase family enzyme
MGLIAVGTANHFARDLGLPDSVEECVGVIAQRHVVAVDVAAVNGRVFLNNSSIGIYPIAVHLRKAYQRKLGWSKRLAMLRAMFRVFREFPMFTVRLDTDAGAYFRKTSFVFVGNNEYVLGRRDDLTGGILTVYTAHLKGRWGILVMGLLSMINILGEKYFDRHLVKTLELDTRKKKMIVSVDGEVVEMPPPLRYSIHPQMLNVFLPPPERS